MNTTAKGNTFENKIYNYFLSLLGNDQLGFASKKNSQIFQHKKYDTDTSRKIEFDITIEVSNPLSKDDGWSSLVVIECKNYNHKVDISDFDEFESKLRNVSGSSIKGIFVTTKGFSRTQIEKAKKEHIALIVFSENEKNWIVSRDINRTSEKIMPILLGDNSVGIQPIIYNDGTFCSIVDLLLSLGIKIEESKIATIPYYKEEEIKQIANQTYKDCLPLNDDIAGEILCKRFPEYRILFENHPIGILGILSFKDKTLTLSEELKLDINRMHFTIAHELGHLILHKPLISNQLCELSDYDVNSTPIMSDEIVTRMEIQADLFASFLIIPELEFNREVRKLFTDLSITTGRLFLDHQSCNQQDVSYCINKLVLKFNVSYEAIKMRLIKENLLKIDRHQPKRLSELFR